MYKNGQKPLPRTLIAALGFSAALSASAADPLQVGFVYIGPIGDHGWTYQHEQGRQMAMEKLGDRVKTSYVENVPEGADAERVIRNMAKGGYDLIFTTSFGYMNPTLKVAKQFPKATYEPTIGHKQANNLGTYLSRSDEDRYVGGVLAAKMTKSKKIGYVASFPIPEAIRDINVIQLALDKYDPGSEIKVVWVNSWFDPGKESDAANALIDQGVDVAFQHTDSPAPIQTAERRGVYSVGYAPDMAHFGPKVVLTSIVDDRGPHYVQATQEVLDGDWATQDFWDGLAEDTIKLPISDLVPEAVKAETEQIITDIKSCAFHPFTGPIRDQSGVVASNAELASMNYYVENLKAELPK